MVDIKVRVHLYTVALHTLTRSSWHKQNESYYNYLILSAVHEDYGIMHS